MVNKYALKSCSRRTVEGFTTDVLSVVFEEEELATSSVTGKKSNYDKLKPAKRMLDQKKLEAVQCNWYFYKSFLNIHTYAPLRTYRDGTCFRSISYF